MKTIFLFLLTLLISSSATAVDKSCAEQLGEKRAALLVRQCINVSPATRPPCNASNACELITSEIRRGCDLLADDPHLPGFCKAKPSRSRTVEGALIDGGGLDDYTVTVLSKDGQRVVAYCDGHCGDLFFPTGKDEPVALRPSFKGKSVILEIATEPNNMRIAGPGNHERLAFIKHFKLLK